MRSGRIGVAVLAVLLALTSAPRALGVDVLQSIGGLPPHLTGLFEEPARFQQAATGVYYVFDRRAHAVYTIDPARTGVRKAVDIGQEPGRIIQPTGFDVAPDGTFVVADTPRRQARIQIFDAAGARLGGFFLPGDVLAHVAIGDQLLNGIGSLRHTGSSLLISHPESGSLVTEYSLTGSPQRNIGRLRATGHEHDRALHVAMNTGLPLVDPSGGFYYVFLTGEPLFRKYDAQGALVFERHVEGRELDPYLAAQPTIWPRRQVGDRELPFVIPAIRTAAVDPQGRLWISLSVPYTYVYDRQGDKIRALQFRGAGTLQPTSLSFDQSGRLLVTPGLYEFEAR